MSKIYYFFMKLYLRFRRLTTAASKIKDLGLESFEFALDVGDLINLLESHVDVLKADPALASKLEEIKQDSEKVKNNWLEVKSVF